MANIIQNIAGMGNMTEQIIASDFLLAAKTGIKTYSQAIAEASTPKVRDVLHRHLDTAIKMHENITNFMIKKGYYYPNNPTKQISADLQAVDTFMNIE